MTDILVDLEKLRDVEAVATAIRASLMSKQYGNEDFLSKLVAKACVASLPKGNILSGIRGPKSVGPKKKISNRTDRSLTWFCNLLF